MFHHYFGGNAHAERHLSRFIVCIAARVLVFGEQRITWAPASVSGLCSVTTALNVSRMDHMFPVTSPFPPSCSPGILLMEVDVMWSSAAGVALLKLMKPALRGPCLLPALQRWMEGSTSQAPHEGITDEGVEGMSSGLILNSPVAPQPRPLAPGPRASEASQEGWWWDLWVSRAGGSSKHTQIEKEDKWNTAGGSRGGN